MILEFLGFNLNMREHIPNSYIYEGQCPLLTFYKEFNNKCIRDGKLDLYN